MKPTKTVESRSVLHEVFRAFAGLAVFVLLVAALFWWLWMSTPRL